MVRASRGFTLVELLVAVVVIAILAAVAVPAYRDQIRKGRRAEAHEALMQVQTAQERWRSNNVSYAATVAALGQSAVSASGNYAIGVSGATATGYTATATAQAKQAGDSACGCHHGGGGQQRQHLWTVECLLGTLGCDTARPASRSWS